MIAYKLFEQDKRDGKLYPLFIGKNTETKVGECLHAEYIPTKGFSTRYGWHCGTIPSAPWLMGLNGKYNSKRGKNFQRVWVEIEYNDSHDYTEEVALLPKKCFQNTEFNGYYHFRETNGHDWIISSDIKVVKILSEEERQQILNNMGVDEMEGFKPYYETMKKRKETLDKKKSIC